MSDLHWYGEYLACGLEQLKSPAVFYRMNRLSCWRSRFSTTSLCFLPSIVEPASCSPTKMVTFCRCSGSPNDLISSMSQIRQRLARSGYHTVCARQWHGQSPCVRSMLLRLRSPEASRRGSSSIIFSCITSTSSELGAPTAGFPTTFCLP